MRASCECREGECRDSTVIYIQILIETYADKLYSTMGSDHMGLIVKSVSKKENFCIRAGSARSLVFCPPAYQSLDTVLILTPASHCSSIYIVVQHPTWTS